MFDALTRFLSSTFQDSEHNPRSTKEDQPKSLTPDIHVSPPQPKRASMPRTGLGAVNTSQVVRESDERFQKFMRPKEEDIEDDQPSIDSFRPTATTQLAFNRVTRISHAHKRGEKDFNGTDRPSKGSRNSEERLIEPRSTQPRDAVEVFLPGNDRFVAMQLKRPSFTKKQHVSIGGLKTLNTLDGPSPLANGRFLAPDPSSTNIRGEGSCHSSKVRDNHYHYSEQPSKRARLDKAPASSRSPGHSITSKLFYSSDNADELQPSSDGKMPPATRNGHEPITGTPSHNNRSATDIVRRAKDVRNPRKNSPRMKQMATNAIELSDDDDPEAFTRNARKERQEARRTRQADADELSEFIRSPREQESVEEQPARMTVKHLPSPERDGSTPPVLQGIWPHKVSQAIVADSSSDELQVEETNVIRRDLEVHQALHEKTGSQLARTINGSTFFRPGRQRQKVKPPGGSGAISIARQIFPLKGLCWGRYANYDRYLFTVDVTLKEFRIDLKDELLEIEPIAPPIGVAKILKISRGTDSSSILMLNLSKDYNHRGSNSHQIVLDLESHKMAYELTQLFQQLRSDIQIVDQSSHRMENIFANAKLPLEASHNTGRRLSRAAEMSQQQAEASISRFFSKGDPDLSKPSRQEADRSSLDSLQQPAQAAKGSTIINSTVQRRGEPLQELDVTQLEIPQRHETNAGDPELLAAITRPSRSKRTTASNAYGGNLEPVTGSNTCKPKYSQDPGLGPPWKRPLVYPDKGKKRETVNYVDMVRFDDDEFLNDSLVSLFLRYLEVHLENKEREMFKRFHFFNSYFYGRLTALESGKKGVNYEGVEKWTRTVDIFNRDFVVVPVNESVHWYVAIICNLTYFKKQHRDAHDDDEDDEEDGAEVVEVGHVEIPSEQLLDDHDFKPQLLSDQTGEAGTRQSFAGLSIADAESGPAERGDDPPGSATTPTSAAKRGPGRRKAKRPSLPKYDPAMPVIITLDSLGSGRSATCKALRQYIVHEASNKKNWTIDGSLIKGMTAKDIPVQGNFSDCGLFLCAYLEKLVFRPETFVRQILQREPQQWPEMESTGLRTRFRDLVQELHRVQEGEKSVRAIPEVGKILLHGKVAESRAAELDQSGQPLTSSRADQAYGTATDELQRVSGPDIASSACEPTVLNAQDVAEVLNRPSPPIEIPDNDDSPEKLLSRRPGKQDYSRKHGRRGTKLEGLPTGSKELAPQSGHGKSPERRRKQRPSQELQEVMRLARSSAENGTQEEYAKARKQRAASVSTEYLAGSGSYAKTPERTRREEEEPKGEVAETQASTQLDQGEQEAMLV